MAGVFGVGWWGLWDVSPTRQDISENIGQLLDSPMAIYFLVDQNSNKHTLELSLTVPGSLFFPAFSAYM